MNLTTVALLFLGTATVYWMYTAHRWYKIGHREVQKTMMMGQRFADQTALTAALTARTRFAIDELTLTGFKDAAVLFEDIIADDEKLRAEYQKQYALLRDEVNKHAKG